MRKSNHSILIGIFIILSLVNIAHGGNFSAGDENLTNKNSVDYNYFFPTIPVDYKVIVTYGKLPELKTQEQRSKWLNIDHGKIINRLGENFTKKYFIPEGPLIGIGSDIDGYIEFMVDRNQTVDKKLLDEMYEIIDKEARKEGFEEVPVIFIFGGPLILTEHVEARDSSNNEKPSENKTNPQPSGELNKSTPGFGLLGGLILLLITGGLFRRK